MFIYNVYACVCAEAYAFVMVCELYWVEIQKLCVCFHLGENGEMSCLSLAQLMVGGGTLWTSQGKTASSPSTTDILTGSAEAPAPPTLGLGRTEHTGTVRYT